MTVPQVSIGILAGILCASAFPAQSIAVLRSGPLPSPQEAADLESRVLENPEDLNARSELLQLYLSTASFPANSDPGRQSVRLQHILYLIERHPEAAVSGSRAAYVYSANGPYANAADHEAARNQWLAAVQAHPRNTAVTMNAVKFLELEDQDDAERVLRRAMEDEPGNREIAANLGFLYAMEVLGLNSMALGAKPAIVGMDHPRHAMAELEQSSNAVLLAAAGTALPNLARAGSVDAINQTMFDLAGQLSARARQLAPDDPDIQGPMPLITYFAAAQGSISALGSSGANPPSRIKVSENVQSANLIRRTLPQYPEEARSAGITGDVRLSIVIGRDGVIQNVQLISGHSLLVQAALKALETWLYKPTLLNGAPVEVATTVTISFPAN